MRALTVSLLNTCSNCHPTISSMVLRFYDLVQLCHKVGAYQLVFGRVILYLCQKEKKAMTCNDYFRGFAISSSLSEVFEICSLYMFKRYFSTEDNQFGFLNKFVKDGSRFLICALDLSEAFYKTNHLALFFKLMKRHIYRLTC